MKYLLPAGFVLASALLLACSAEDVAKLEQQSPPNILFILIDDLGYNDLGMNNGVLAQTPHLNAFAQEGVHFTRHYVDSTCSATRAGIMTGTYPVASGFRPSGLGISPETETLPEALQSLGYSTHHIGKWHLGYASRMAWPQAQGYDSFYGFLNQFLLRGPHEEGRLNIGRPTYRNPWLQEDDRPPEAQQGHLTDLLLKRVLAFLDDAPTNKPWFLNYWTYLPHTPLQPASRFAKRYPSTPEGRYRAMLAQLDDAVGQVLLSLRRNNLLENTLIVIASDNGGTNAQTNNNAPFFGSKASFMEGGVRTPLMIRWPDGRGAGSSIDQVVSYLDYFPTIVTAAGGSAPADMPGRDIGLLIEGAVIQSKELYWEAGDSKVSAWSVLSADGQWRLQQYYQWEPQLYNLLADPGGSIDVSDRYPDRVAAMYSRFLRWRDFQRRVPLTYIPDLNSGGGRLIGDSLQRAPGFGGFTFGIGISTAEDDVAHDAEQVIAAQSGYWRLSQVDGMIKAKVNGVELNAPAPTPGRCNAIIVTTLFAHRNTDPESSEAFVELYIDGRLAANARQVRPALPADSYEKPTTIGQGAKGGARFRGLLGKPVVINERLRAQSEADPWTHNGVAKLSSELCIPSEV